MFNTLITPRFNDTDALGHVNHAAVAMWFETARRPLFKLFIPDLNPRNWNLIIVRLEIDYKQQLFYQQDVEIKSYLQHLGSSSMVLTQQAWQGAKLCAEGKATLVHFDYQTQKSQKIPDTLRRALQKHLISPES